MDIQDRIALIYPDDVLKRVGDFVRTVRQRERMKQSELAVRSGVPASTISRLERTGLASTDSLFKILFALDQLDGLEGYFKERQRLVSFPKNLSEDVMPVQRVRH